MTPAPATCPASATVEQAAKLMAGRDIGTSLHKIQRILVCVASGKPVGVIGLQDLARSQDEGEVGSTVREVKQEAPLSLH